MENFSWFNMFRDMGARVKAETAELVSGRGAGSPLGKGASGDTTFAVDKRAEDAIVSVLEEAHESGEEFTFISEELGERGFGGGNAVILADPVDGSNNAKYGLPFYCTSIALATGRRLSDVVLGYIMNLTTGDEFWAIKGGGAFRNGIPVRTSAASELGMLNFECSRPGRDLKAAATLIESSRKVRCLGSIALDLAALSCGMTDAVLVPSPSRSFDFAAGWLMVNEAGGAVTDTAGMSVSETPLGVNRACTLLAAANRPLLEKALGILGGG